MRYAIYPEGIKRLEGSGLKKIIDKGVKDYTISPHFGHVTTKDVYNATRHLKKEGFYSSVNPDELKIFLKVFEDFYYNPKKPTWKVEENEYDGGLTGVAQDMLLMSGLPVSGFLPGETLGKYKELGFDSLSEFLGTMGVYLNSSSGFHNPAGMWSTKNNGRTFENNLSSSQHSDFAAYRYETTPKETTDLLGNPVHYRPITPQDNQSLLCSSHAELNFLAIILKWAHETKIPSSLLKDKGKEFLKLTNDLDPKPYIRDDLSLEMALNNSFLRDIPLFGTSDSRQFLPKHYAAYLGENKTLIFGKEKFADREISEYYPGEIDDMIRGLCIQANKYVGRTSLGELSLMVKKRFSDEFEKEMDII